MTKSDKRLVKKLEESRELKIEIVKFAKNNNINLSSMVIDLEIIKGAYKEKIFVVIVKILDKDTGERYELPVTMKNNLKKVIVLSKDVNAFVRNILK